MDNAIKIIKTLENAGHTAYIVGGAVRDMLMGKTPKDYDIATSASPDVVCALFDKCIKTGIKHGTVTVLMDNAYEVTTYRAEHGYADNRHPEEVVFISDIEADLMRRDFTVNAMAYHYSEGVLDPFGGKNDLSNKLLRCVGDPYTRFNEDALRMLRCIRFASVLGFDIEKSTFAAICELSNKIKFISAERIKQELDKILLSDNPDLLPLLKSGLLEQILPELCAGANLHNITSCLNHLSPVLALRWAALLQDISSDVQKACTLADGVANRLKFPNKLRKTVIELIKHKDYDICVNENLSYAVKRALNLMSDTFDMWLDLKKAKAFNCPKKLYDIQLWQETASKIRQNREPYLIKHMDITGNDLLEAGISPCNIGNSLNRLLDFVMNNPKKNKRDILILQLKNVSL